MHSSTFRSLIFQQRHSTIFLLQALGIVIALGPTAEIGKIQKMMEDADAGETPLQRQLDVFGYWLSIITIIVAFLSFFLAWKARDIDIPESFAIAVGIAVAIIPEGLPSVVTITLALGVRRMADHKAIIRQLPAVETLGSVSVVCSDKTGTLTYNEMMVTAVRTATKHFTVGMYMTQQTRAEGHTCHSYSP